MSWQAQAGDDLMVRIDSTQGAETFVRKAWRVELRQGAGHWVHVEASDGGLTVTVSDDVAVHGRTKRLA